MSDLFAVVPAAAQHAVALAATIRDGDRQEIEAGGYTPQRAVWRSYRSSTIARTGLLGREVAAMWGVVGSAMGTSGQFWFLTSVLADRVHPVSFVRIAQRERDLMLSMFPALWGFVAADYQKACRFIAVLGFTLSDPVPFGPKGRLFRHFEMVR